MRIAVVGAGTMGGGIAMLCAMNGLDTVNIEADAARCEAARRNTEAYADKLAGRGKLAPEQRQSNADNQRFSAEIADDKGADVILEAVPENMALKTALYRRIAQHADKGALLFTNTSGFSITELAESAPDATRFAGVHFFNPPMVMALVELVKGKKTSEAALNSAREFVLALGKTPVDAPETPGFIVNRVLIPMINCAAYLVYEGANPADVDIAMKLGANHPIGPLALADSIGIDVVLAVLENFAERLPQCSAPVCPVFAQLVAQGNLGRKSGKGFYEYPS